LSSISGRFGLLYVVGYIAGKFPSYKALTNLIATTWKYAASLIIHDSRWLIFKFDFEEDKLAVLYGGSYLVFRRPLVLKPMLEYFDFAPIEMTTTPVWVNFPNLPLKCWSLTCLFKIVSVIDNPY